MFYQTNLLQSGSMHGTIICPTTQTHHLSTIVYNGASLTLFSWLLAVILKNKQQGLATLVRQCRHANTDVCDQYKSIFVICQRLSSNWLLFGGIFFFTFFSFWCMILFIYSHIKIVYIILKFVLQLQRWAS